MDIKLLETFITAAKYQNFRKASEKLFLSQPALTKQIDSLEKKLGVELFERVGRRVQLTISGHYYLPYAEQILEVYQKGIENLHHLKNKHQSKLTIAIAPQIAASLSTFIRSFLEQHKDIEIVIHVINSNDIGKQISSGKFMVGLATMKPLQSNVNVEKIWKDPVVLVAPRMDACSEAHLIEEQLFHQYKIITYNHPEYWDDLLINIRQHYPWIQTIVVNNAVITKLFIEQGVGISFLPLSMVKRDLEKKMLTQIIPRTIQLPNAHTYLITKILTPEVEVFTHELERYFTSKISSDN